MMHWSRKFTANRHRTGIGLAVLLIVQGLMLPGCTAEFFSAFAIQDYEPVIKLPSGSQVRVKTSRSSVKIEYRTRF